MMLDSSLSHKTTIRKLLLGLAIGSAFLIILEIALQVLFLAVHNPFELTTCGPEDNLYRVYNNGFFEMFPNFKTQYRSWTGELQTVQTNRFGFRDEEFMAGKPEGVYRIFNLGDSITFGEGLEDVRQTYVEQLEILFNERDDERRFEVINTGVPGYGIMAVSVTMEKILQFQPDLVTVCVGWNDHTSHVRLNEVSGVFPALASKLNWLSNLQLVKILKIILRPLIEARLRAALENQDITEYVTPLDQFQEKLEYLIEITDNLDCELLLMTSPSGIVPGKEPKRLLDLGGLEGHALLIPLHQKYNDGMRETAKAHNTPLFDLAELFNHLDPYNYYKDPEFDPIHPNAKGHQFIAKHLYQFISERYLDPVESDLPAEKHPESLDERALRLFREAKALEAEKKYQEAIAKCRDIFTFHPNYYWGHFEIGYLYHLTEHLPQALEHYHKALAADQNNTLLLKNIGYVLAEMREYEKAKTYFERAALFDPSMILMDFQEIVTDLNASVRGE